MKTDIQKIKKLLGLSGDEPLTPEEKRRRAKFVIYPLFFLMFAGAILLIYAPTQKEREEAGKGLGFNTEIPSPEELAEACRKAALSGLIERLPRGLDTPVGELGETLSGGERQRIGLARVFLHDAPFVLLDEPTSNLDSLNEAAVLRALSEGRGDKTVVLVSHRASTAAIADVEYTVDRGRLG